MGDELAFRLLAEIQALRAEVCALNNRFDRLDQTGIVPPAAHRLVQALADRFPGEPFRVRDLLLAATVENPALMIVIEAACGRIDARVVGQKLAKLSARPIAGYAVRPLKKEHSARLWLVEKSR